MRRSRRTLRAGALLVAAGALASLGWIDAAEWAAAAGGVAAPIPPPPRPLSIRADRVRFALTPGGAAITHELSFAARALSALVPAGAGDATLFVGFTAQSRPLAFEATLVPLDGAGAPDPARAQALKVEHVVVRPQTAPMLIGHARAAGHVIHLPRTDAAFVLRLRSAIAVDPGHRVVHVAARLSTREGGYLPLERVEVVGAMGTRLRGARATLCGPGADPRPIALTFPDYRAPAADPAVVAPAVLRRQSEDDLCLEAQID